MRQAGLPLIHDRFKEISMQAFSSTGARLLVIAVMALSSAACNKGDANSSASGGPGNSTGTATGSTSGGSTSATVGADNGSGKLGGTTSAGSGGTSGSGSGTAR
jgi:hypothetical protein